MPSKRPPIQKSPGRVFISHSTKNERLAQALRDELESHGVACWIAPRDIAPGSTWAKAIIQGMSGCRLVVLLLTEQANHSPHVMLEIERAINKRIPLLPVRIQEICLSPELEYFTSASQWFDATSEPFEKHLRSIRHRVCEILGAKRSTRGLVPTRKPGRGVLSWLLLVPLAAVLMFMVLWRGGDDSEEKPSGDPSPASLVSSQPDAFEGQQVDDGMSRTIAAQPSEDAAANDLRERIEEKGRSFDDLRAFAEERLSRVHLDVLRVEKNGPPHSGTVVDRTAVITASCHIKPNEARFESFSKDFARILESVALEHGSVEFDGLRSEDGRDKNGCIDAAHKKALTIGQGGLIEIFGREAERSFVAKNVVDGRCDYIQFDPFYGMWCHGNRSYWELREKWTALLSKPSPAAISGSSPGVGDSIVVILLTGWRNAYRHTDWRWFHLSAEHAAVIRARLPTSFQCAFSLTDARGAVIESADVMLEQYAVGYFATYGRSAPPIIVSPFFVEQDMEYYTTGITISWPIVVLREDGGRVRDYAVSLEQGPLKSR